jgi:phage shock protein A
MTSLMNRIKRITVSRIESFIETVEEPETVYPELIRELQNRIGDVGNAEKKAAAAFNACQRRLDESMGRSRRLEEGAEMALRLGKEPLAREALAEQVRVDRGMEGIRLSLLQSEAALQKARESRLHLQIQLKALIRRKREIISRARSEETTERISRQMRKIRVSGAAILEEVSRMQQADDEKGALPGTSDEPSIAAERSLEERLRALEREAEIERRLTSIRNRKQSKPSGTRETSSRP